MSGILKLALAFTLVTLSAEAGEYGGWAHVFPSFAIFTAAVLVALT